jgi:hypothetical protein
VDTSIPAFVSCDDKELTRKIGAGSIATGARTVNTIVCYRGLVSGHVIVFTAQGEPEEEQVRAFLGAHGIPVFTRGEALRKTHGLTLNGLGQVEIMVAAEHADEARRLLAEVERGDFTLDESTET